MDRKTFPAKENEYEWTTGKKAYKPVKKLQALEIRAESQKMNPIGDKVDLLRKLGCTF